MKLTPSTSHKLLDTRPVWLLALCALRLKLKVEKQPVEMVKATQPKATQEPLPWDESGPAHSTAWLRCLEKQDEIKEEAFEKMPPDEQKT